MRVLIVDDDPDTRRVAEISLQKVAGWATRTAGSGREALQIMAEDEFDLFVFDIMMPEMDGPTLLQTVRQGPAASVPVVFLTAKIQKQEVDRILALGARGFIPKPFDPMTLATEIARILGT